MYPTARSYSTAPTRANARSYKDTDHDLVPDYVENADGTDPNDPADFKDDDTGGTPTYVETVLYPHALLLPSNPNDPADDNRDTDGDRRA